MKRVALENTTLLDMLNAAYADEWQAYVQYWLGSKLNHGEDTESKDLSKELMVHAKEELEHADWLADKIIELGGDLVLNPSEWASTGGVWVHSPG